VFRNLTLSALVLVFLSQPASSEQKRYEFESCTKISEAIDFLLMTTNPMWLQLTEDPNDEETALSISWAVGLAADYTTIYQAFCEG
jgi:hypothetical protein